MAGTVWTKFYWADWQSDPALRLCSYSARGLWMELLCIAGSHDPIGYVAVAGRALDETAIARMTGGSESEVRSLLGELDRNGVFSRDRQGRIYSRRMVSDAKKAAIARKNGKNGGNPKLGKQSGNSSSDNLSDKSPLKPQEPEARVISEAKASGAPVAETPDAEAWRRAVGVLVSVGKLTEKASRSLFGKILKENGLEPREMLLAVVNCELKGTLEPQSYLLSAGKQIGDRLRKAEKPTASDALGWDDDTWRHFIQKYRENPDNWGKKMGPKPGEPGCFVPTHLLLEIAA